MEKTQTELKFTKQNFDKFKNRTDIEWIDPFKGIYNEKATPWMWPFYNISGHLVLYCNLRQVKTPEFTSIVIDYDIKAKDWFFARNGKLIININGLENIELEPHESNTEVGVGFDKSEVQERGFYNISYENLKKICDSDNLSIRISGGSSYLDIKDKELLKFKFMFRSFFSEVYDDHTYDDFIVSVASPEIIKLATKYSQAKSAGCFIATAAMGDYDHPVVMDLRQFRDNWLLKRNWGVNFTNWYYTHGPKAANFIEKSTLMKKITFYTIVKPLQVLTKNLK